MSVPGNVLPATQRRRLGWIYLLLAAPALIVYAILTPLASRLPISDDYDAALGYLNHMVRLTSPSAKLFYLATAQHNEYKLWFVNTLIWLQYRAFGTIDFRLAALFSNLLLIPLIFVLWKLFLPRLHDPCIRLLLFLPVTCLWFQLNYVETVDWAVSAYQTLPILIAALLGFYLLARNTRATFNAALLCIPAAIGSSGNGFLFSAVAAVLLFRQRRFRALAVWCAVTLLFVLLYASGYTLVHELSDAARPLPLRIFMRPAFFFIWLGSASVFHLACPILGVLMLLFWLNPRRRQFLKDHPAIAYTLLFIFLSGCMIAFGRVGNGVWSARGSRYRLYSDLVLIFTWFATAQRLASQSPAALLRSRMYLTVTTAAVLFSLGMDAYGLLYLRKRDDSYRQAMEAYQRRRDQSGSAGAPLIPLPTNLQDPVQSGWGYHAGVVLEESKARGVYEPPRLQP